MTARIRIAALLAITFFTQATRPPNASRSAAPPALSGLWAYYPIYNGNYDDQSGNHHALRLMNGAKLSSDAAGGHNGALEFNGRHSYGLIADGAEFRPENFSVAFFVMARENKGLYFGKQDYHSGHAATFNVGIDPVLFGTNTRFSVTLNQNTICSDEPRGGLLAAYQQSFTAGVWHHVAITFGSGVMKLYIDGALQATRTIPYKQVTYCSSGQFIVGDWWSGGENGFDGKMDELRIYTRVITDREIKNLAAKI